MPERPRYSRFRRLPGLFRIGDLKPPDPHADPQPLTVYLPGRILDMAEALAARHGASTIQDYCEELLRMAIEDEDAAAKTEGIQLTLGTLESLDELANTPDYLAEWSASSHVKPDVPVLIVPDSARMQPVPGGVLNEIYRHAGMDEADSSGFLPTLRRGEIPPVRLVDDLLTALGELESRLANAHEIERRLAYALHRLGFEGQVLLTDSMSEAGSDPATIHRLRRVQEAVDRVLSGEDVRYFPGADPPGDLSSCSSA